MAKNRQRGSTRNGGERKQPPVAVVASEKGGHHRLDLDRFPTEAEVRRDLALEGSPLIDPDALDVRLSCHLLQALPVDVFSREPQARPVDVRDITLTPVWRADKVSLVLKPWIVALLLALRRPRVDHRTLDAGARNKFNQALQDAHSDGSYQTLAAVHADMSHRMHSNMGTIAAQRFLPWHRIYALQVENLLRAKQAGVTIPYWNYSNDGARPDWVWKPPAVTRGTPGANGGALPSQATVDGLIQNAATFTTFSQGVEFNAHNQVHNWCNGTISSPSTATQDPIFWLLHSNVDRIWDQWQLTHTGVPSLSGSDAVLDPWAQTATDANDVVKLGYVYE